MVYLVLTALYFNKIFQRKNTSQFSFCLYHHCIITRHPIPCTPTPRNHSWTFMKHSFCKNVDVHQKGRTNNNIVLNKVQATGKSNFHMMNKGSSHSWVFCKIHSFFMRTSKLCLRLAAFNFFSFLRLKCS